MLYLDASALVPLYTPEAASEDVERIIMAAERVAVSDLTVAEAKNAIIRKGRRRQSLPDDVIVALRLIDEHVAARRFVLVEMRRDFLIQVPALSQQAPVHLRTMDAVHLAAALAIEASAMATYDHDLATAARAHGLMVLGAPA